MCDTKDEAQKWKCEICTYENYPSSLKCTMCQASKALLSEDIFRLSPAQESSSIPEEAASGLAAVEPTPTPTSTCYTLQSQQSQQPQLRQSNVVDSEKWECKVCTYLNWPRSVRCVQCCTKRGGEAMESRNDNDNEADADCIDRAGEALHALRISGSDTELVSTKDTAARQQQKQQLIGATASNRLSLSPSPTIDDATYLNNLANASHNQSPNKRPANQQQHQQHQQQQQRDSSVAVAVPLQPKHCYVAKWACNSCTYENWPRSIKCSMCGKTREREISGSQNDLHASSSQTIQDEHQNVDTVSVNNSFNKKHIYQLGSSETINNCDTLQERQERRQRQIRRQVDWQWLNACLGVVENNYSAVEAYLSCGGNPARSLTSNEIAALNRNSAFDVGHTLIHLAIRFHREEMLPMLLAQISGSGPGIKRVPSYVAPDLAADIRRHFANTLRLRKSGLPCHYVQKHATFALPAEIEELPIPIQEQLYDELLDRDAQKQLETPPPALNWSLEITARLSSRMFVLWNRSAGDCLLDSAMQATWGVFDRDNILRRTLADTLHQCGHVFFTRWKEYEMLQASMLHFTLEESQWEDDWSTLLSLASQPGSSLEQLHIFALAHILRRPIIVYGVKYVKSFRGEDIGYARFEGVYLPLFWDQNFCTKSPIALGYTRGHFSALVPMEPFTRIDGRRDDVEDVTYLPLMDCELKLLPIHFLTQSEVGNEESMMRQWLDVCVTDGGLLVAQQKLGKRPLLVAQMLEEWLNHYRRIAQVITAPFVRRPQITHYSSEGDSDEE
ncbi:GL27321 [Drosophila persimilis]|uniref:ubiquitinyl hydrolase 1 n=1 Tax=Drosophila persimilis TaxID=7234 RepID=B4GZ81_DROPE|nr:ubiquitin thioesterase trabid [Drosophila persimilis]XP_026850868.1 ubiquitin thioesterase trabid [Drosophila persimilis]XP_026850869.1 ubiquitin thioesterase trabid [Drosophila persimilis]XP_026850870.1 ubiquitin thioesterase trabid [Drosophila persimilis]EDW28099.1 GL27321 [Drosophila persimilis]